MGDAADDLEDREIMDVHILALHQMGKCGFFKCPHCKSDEPPCSCKHGQHVPSCPEYERE